MAKQIRVHERSPLNCSHPEYAVNGRKCSRCGSREVPTFKHAPPPAYVSTPYTATDAAYDAEIEREAIAARR